MSDPPNSRFLAYFDTVGKIVAGLTGVVLLISATVSLVYLLWPDPSPPPPPQKVTMAITDTVREPFVDFLLGTGQAYGQYTDAELRQLGNTYYISVDANGLRNTQPQLVWTLRGDVGNLPLTQRKSWIHQVLARLKPTADAYVRTAKVWIQYPPFAGRFYAVIEIEYPQFEPLAAIHTRSFAGLTTQPRGAAPPPATRTTTVTTTIPATTTAVTTTVTGLVTTTVSTTVDGTVATTTATVPTTSTRTTSTTIPATTSATTTTTTQPTTAPIPVVRPKAIIVSSR